MKKGIYSLVALQDIFFHAKHRYLAFISTLDDNRVGSVNLNKISKNVTDKNHSYKGFNFFNDEDHQIFLTIALGLKLKELVIIPQLAVQS